MSFGASGSTTDASLSGFKQFVSEEELDEKRRKRQEEWDKVRQPDEPLEAPEEKYDPRCLYDRLEEQKQKKQDEIDEQFKLKNQVKGLESDEVEFLDYVSQKQMEVTKQREQEENAALSEYRNAVTNLVVDKAATGKASLALKKTTTASGKKSQVALLAGAVKRKGSDSQSPVEKKAKMTDEGVVEETGGSDGELPDSTTEVSSASADKDPSAGSASVACADSTTAQASQAAKVVGVLPGLGAYTDTSSSDSNSSDSDDIEIPPLIYRRKYAVIQQSQ